jgi:DNA (cytosine-5)-methyltransferase 1
MLRLLDTFSGIGGFSLAARWLGGYETVQFVECEPFCRRVLRQHWPNVPISNDICTFKPKKHSADVIAGGFPCQDISFAGKQKGINQGTRSGLFHELLRVIRAVEPKYVVLENVAAIRSNGIETVLSELAQAGYDAEWACIRASDVGAIHKRDRWWLVAYSISNRSKRDLQQEVPWQSALQRVESVRGFADLRNGPALSTPRLLRGTDGLPNKLDRLHAIGNSVVPHVAMIPLARVLDLELQSESSLDILGEMLECRHV